MSKKIIVIEVGGYLTTKDEKDVLNTDNVIHEAKSEQEAEDIIHGQTK